MSAALLVVTVVGWTFAAVALAALWHAEQRVALLSSELAHADEYGALWHERARCAETSLRLVLLDSHTDSTDKENEK